jgi:quercetin dioxygenase-like cupin family protein
VPEPIRIADLPSAPVAARFEGRDHGARVSFFVAEFQPGGGPAAHRHPYEETFVVQEGSVVFEVDGETLEARGGEIVVVPAGSVHRFSASGEGTLRFVSIHPVPAMEQEFVGAQPG